MDEAAIDGSMGIEEAAIEGSMGIEGGGIEEGGIEEGGIEGGIEGSMGVEGGIASWNPSSPSRNLLFCKRYAIYKIPTPRTPIGRSRVFILYGGAIKLLCYRIHPATKMLKSRHTLDSKMEVGIDEAGRGCLWGPLVAAAVVWPEESAWTEEVREISMKIKDSKQIRPKQRQVLEKQIQTHAIAWSIGRVEAEEIDRLGMTKSNRLAFERALNGLGQPNVGRILIDGILGISPREGVEQIVEPKGDGTYLSIAAASIIAKEGRDRIVTEICEGCGELEEKYSILRSKGYGTLKHREAIKKYGMHALHRRLFLRKLLGLEHTVSEEYAFIED